LEEPLNRNTLLLALAAALTLPAAAQAQNGSPLEQPRTTVNRNANPVPPRFGFAVGAKAGPNNTFGHPFVHVVVPGSNAARAGIQVGDTILTINGRDARQGKLFPVQVAGTRYLLRVRRGREELELTYIFPVIPPRAARPAEPARRP
jgi:membrane-associated protease RseP (regulator of RpoE activity)